MTKWKAFVKKLLELLDDVLAYLLTIAGILFSAYLPLLKTGEDIQVSVSWWKLLVAAACALMVVAKQEIIVPDDKGNIDKSRAGRKRRFLLRMANALAQGIMWDTFIQFTNKMG